MPTQVNSWPGRVILFLLLLVLQITSNLVVEEVLTEDLTEGVLRVVLRTSIPVLPGVVILILLSLPQVQTGPVALDVAEVAEVVLLSRIFLVFCVNRLVTSPDRVLGSPVRILAALAI